MALQQDLRVHPVGQSFNASARPQQKPHKLSLSLGEPVLEAEIEMRPLADVAVFRELRFELEPDAALAGERGL